ncbi:HDIG [Desulfamplus magnetovallimortis]|uniref:HDIG n=1 Tax=Desulfamplus magnetovallimortis TaxID=1246637 RepID=A0A1W1HD28_9BACT|nr:HDOD domain-containing protein [Desulfamplus magnetovallimortis]SLM30278.1 HDIG [Desulfamplus magnetovallimortis]
MSQHNKVTQAKKLLARLKEMKTLPSVAARLTRMIADDKSTMQDFEEVIKVDPTLVLRILRLVNSPFYALRTKVKTISEAVAYIGIDNLRNLIVVDALKNLFTGKQDEEVFSRTRLWMHCVAVAICSQMIVERIFGIKGEDAFLCGIVHDIGLIIEDQIMPDEFLKVCMEYKPEKNKNIVHYETGLLETDHTIVGSLLVHDWHLPRDVQQGVLHHHDILSSADPKTLPSVIQTADYLVSRLKYNILDGMKGELSPPLMLHIKDNIKEYKTLADGLPEELAKAEDIYALDRG